MTFDSFEPLVAELDIKPASDGSPDMKTAVTEFFKFFIKEILADQPAFVGHIKGFCKGDGADYLRISYVTANTGLDVAGDWHHNPEQATLTMNVHGIGLKQDDMDRVLCKTERRYGKNISIRSDSGR